MRLKQWESVKLPRDAELGGGFFTDSPSRIVRCVAASIFRRTMVW